MDPTKSYELNNNRPDGSSETRVQALPTAGVAEDILDMINALPRRHQVLPLETSMHVARLS